MAEVELPPKGGDGPWPVMATRTPASVLELLQRLSFNVPECQCSTEVRDLIASDQLNVVSEEVVYKSIVTWIRHDASTRERTKMIFKNEDGIRSRDDICPEAIFSLLSVYFKLDGPAQRICA
ncbi:hypothetical protein AVEN_261363-1 [Araneus ventricosus]|uniref:BACK domain-containing protein n=1 Tax=Araneus ventricosus TaxID=182803 RepID=A0A4Y2SIR3_ARAVE|nr:hypothetical protein AVEN_261363-1 [Araneus ventricosus]